MANAFLQPQILAGLVADPSKASNPDGSPASGLTGKAGEILVAQVHARDYTMAYRGAMGFSTTLARATSLAATSQVGNIVVNPIGSGVNLALRKWSLAVLVTSATTTAFTLGYTYQATTPTGLTVADAWGQSMFTSGSTATTAFRPSKAQAYAAATLLVAPLPFHQLVHNTAAIATTGVDQLSGDLEGAYIIPPGGIVAICAVGAAAAASAVNSTLTWEEIPI